MFKNKIIKYITKYLLIALSVMCFPWAVTLALGHNSHGYIYNSAESGRYVLMTQGKVDVEDFTAFVVASQMSIDEEEEALKAQAVIVRTYIYKMLEEAGSDSIRAEDTGFTYRTYSELEELWGEAFPDKYNKLMKIVDNTACQVITYEGKLIKPYFHASSSGYTRNGSELFEEKMPYLLSVQSSKDVESDNYLQGILIEKKEFADKLRGAKSGISISDEKPLETLQIISRCEAGYIKSLQIGNVVMTGDEFSYIFDLNSPNFQVEEYDGRVRIITKGMGHGLGLSMYGACELAKSGKSYQEILKHYYTGVEITTKAKEAGE